MKSDSSLNILNAYQNTVYRLINHGIDILIGEKNGSFMNFLSEINCNRWAIITASNPGSIPLDKKDNISRNEKLMRDIEDLNYNWYPVLGNPEEESYWEAEDSFFIPDIELSIACKLGHTFEQNAIVYGIQNCLPSLIWLNEV